jgi:hypothetical protein
MAERQTGAAGEAARAPGRAIGGGLVAGRARGGAGIELASRRPYFSMRAQRVARDPEQREVREMFQLVCVSTSSRCSRMASLRDTGAVDARPPPPAADGHRRLQPEPLGRDLSRRRQSTARSSTFDSSRRCPASDAPPARRERRPRASCAGPVVGAGPDQEVLGQLDDVAGALAQGGSATVSTASRW